MPTSIAARSEGLRVVLASGAPLKPERPPSSSFREIGARSDSQPGVSCVEFLLGAVKLGGDGLIRGESGDSAAGLSSLRLVHEDRDRGVAGISTGVLHSDPGQSEDTKPRGN